ncbi:MAG: hypothetical protein U1E86_11620 [Burkholderiaceae bacterium]
MSLGALLDQIGRMFSAVADAGHVAEQVVARDPRLLLVVGAGVVLLMFGLLRAR